MRAAPPLWVRSSARHSQAGVSPAATLTRSPSSSTTSPGPTSLVNLAFFTYDKRALVGVNMDTKSIPDTQVFMDCLNESFDEVAALGR